ncbi:MAG TPA: hypothetical protein VFX28_05250 [Methylomirabilota bacterium]|nr:hypothetical protein [Methylomirabilota bacterium]
MAAAIEVPTLVDVMAELAARGFTEQFMLAGARLRAVQSGKLSTPDEVRLVEFYRFEGVSDPDDMAILYALETRSGVRGTLADAFGVYAEPGVGAFMEKVRRPR